MSLTFHNHLSILFLLFDIGSLVGYFFSTNQILGVPSIAKAKDGMRRVHSTVVL